MKTTAKQKNHGPNIRGWREWRKINKYTLAKELGVSEATLSGYEMSSNLENEIIEKIAKALNIPVEAITELEQGMAVNIFSVTRKDNFKPGLKPLDKAIKIYDEKLALYERMLNTISELNNVLKEGNNFAMPEKRNRGSLKIRFPFWFKI